MRLKGFIFAVLLPAGFAGVIDRVAVVIDKQVITESEVLENLRLTDFLNNQPLDLGPAARRADAERMVDQELLRKELDNSGFVKPPGSQADVLLRNFRHQRFHTIAAYRAAVEKYGISEDALKQRLLWQATVIGFTDFRFGAGRPNATEASDGQSPGGQPPADGSSVDQALDAWLKQARNDAAISFKPEAFQ
jgi:hypothetical protein